MLLHISINFTYFKILNAYLIDLMCYRLSMTELNSFYQLHVDPYLNIILLKDLFCVILSLFVLWFTELQIFLLPLL